MNNIGNGGKDHKSVAWHYSDQTKSSMVNVRHIMKMVRRDNSRKGEANMAAALLCMSRRKAKKLSGEKKMGARVKKRSVKIVGEEVASASSYRRAKYAASSLSLSLVFGISMAAISWRISSSQNENNQKNKKKRKADFTFVWRNQQRHGALAISKGVKNLFNHRGSVAARCVNNQQRSWLSAA